MVHFPADAPQARVLKTLAKLGFRIIRVGNHIAMIRDNADGTTTPLTMPNHPTIKGSTLRSILTQTGISREDFLRAYQDL